MKAVKGMLRVVRIHTKECKHSLVEDRMVYLMFFFIGSVFSNRYCQCAMIISRQRGHIKGVKVQVRVLLESQRLLFLELINNRRTYPSEDGHCRDGRVHFFFSKNNYYFAKKKLL